MPTVADNKKKWDGDYQWPNQGDEWSSGWGGASMEWYGTILPRIHQFIPTGSILEIACGYGRWTQFLKDMCQHLIVVDLSEKCIQACQQRFVESSNIEYYLTDGKSLQMIPDASMDFVFSFDSLVHADKSVLQAYLSQLPRILKDDGAAFIHHSNLAEYHLIYGIVRRIPWLGAVLKWVGILEKDLRWRDSSVSAKLVEEIAEEHGLKCISQEVVPWGTKRAQIDCFTTIVKNGSPSARNNRILRNANFGQEVRNLARLSQLYAKNKN